MNLFGQVDGGVEGAQGFIQLDPRWGDIALEPGNRRVRILVGRRGAGKSRYLRAMERDAAAHHGEGLLVFPQKDDSVWISEMRWLHRTYAEVYERIEVWRRLWGCAIYASLASYLLNFPPAVGTSINLEKEEREFFAQFCADKLDTSKVCFPVVMVLNLFLKRYQDRSRLDAFIADPGWVALENQVLKVIANSTPIGCYIDTLDETFQSSPAAATDCQVGLLVWMLRKSLDPHVNHRIHLVVAVRDTIFASLMQSEHGRRYDRSDLIRCLDWNDDAAADFLHQKVALLSPKVRVAPNAKGNPIKSWLGFDVVANSMRKGRSEKVSELIVRHTRFLPREIIEIGNALAKHVQTCLAEGRRVEPGAIVQIVMNEAKRQADLALETATDHMMALDSHHNGAVVVHDFRHSVIQAIDNAFIPALRDERFTREMLVRANDVFSEAVGGWSPTLERKALSLGDVLWLHGLIGFEDQSGPVQVARYFSSAKSMRSYVSGKLPLADHYYLHSALLGANRIVIGAEPPKAAAADPND